MMRSILAVLVLCTAVFAAPPEGWSLLQVPGSWQNAFPQHQGFAWYRCYVKVPEIFVKQQEKTLWLDSLNIITEGIKDAYEIHINGVKVASGGSFPPQFAGSEGAFKRHKIQPGILKKDAYNTVAIRIYSQGPGGGFRGGAPILGSYDTESILAGPWEFRVGDDPAWAAPALDKKPDHSAFEEFNPSTSPLQRPEKYEGGIRVSPAEAYKQMTVSPDIALDQVLAEPVIAQPLQMSWDEKGRLWVVEYRQYPYAAGMKILSRDRYYRAVYDRMSPPPPNQFKGNDRISVHEDVDGDGVFDKHWNFASDLNMVTATCRGRGGVWVCNPPYLLFYKDADNDGHPDGPPEVHLEGFGLEDTHSVINSIRWGADGWLYFCNGNSVSSRIHRPGGPELVYSNSSAVWRYHPESRRFEYFSEGAGNNHGLDVDSQGRLYSGYNGGDTRGFHFAQGGYYYKGPINKMGELSNPYIFGVLPMMSHPKAGRFVHTIVRYEDKLLPERFRDRFIGVDPLHQTVVLSDIFKEGSTFKTLDQDIIVKTTDPVFRPVQIAVGPDGAVYVADFCEQYIAHGQHFQGQIDPDTGRIYRIRPRKYQPLKPFDLSKLNNDELIALLSHENRWHRQTALRLIGDRADRSMIPKLAALLEGDTGQLSLEALWAIHQCGGFTDNLALQSLDHANDSVRMWAVRLLGDADKVSPAIAAELCKLALREKNPEVRSQLASTAKRLAADQGLPIVQHLLTHDEDDNDPFIPLLIWWAVEDKAAKDPAAVLAIFDDPALWDRKLVFNHLAQRVMRRYAMAGSQKDLLLCAKLLAAAPDVEHAKPLMKGLEESFKGRSMAKMPEELVAAIAKAGGESLVLSVRRGDVKAVEQALGIIGDDKAPADKRLLYVQAFGEVRQPRCVPALLKLLAGKVAKPDLKNAALTALQQYDDPAIAPGLIKIFGAQIPEVRRTIQTTLASRSTWALRMLTAVDQGAIPLNLIDADVIEQVRLHKDPEAQKLLDKHFPRSAPVAIANKEQYERVMAVIQARPGNPYQGKEVFTPLCAGCHKLWAKGGSVGPDLTSYQRDNLDTMLNSILTPSAEIREGFNAFIVATKDGRALTGFIADQDQRIVVLRGLDSQNVTLQRDQIASMTPLGRSLMPEGLLQSLSEKQIQDLFSFLRNSLPIY